VSDLLPPPDAGEWLGLTAEPLPVGAALDWATLPGCGAVVVFTGTVRDHAEGREEVTHLEYEAYESEVVPTLAAVVVETRRRWPVVARIALLHRVGVVDLGEPSVVVVVSAPHRPEAFDAARFAIDTLKETVPIWKREFWKDGSGWGQGARHVTTAAGATAPAETGG
jgi:molybdopterin synthase catalytic subunit